MSQDSTTHAESSTARGPVSALPRTSQKTLVLLEFGTRGDAPLKTLVEGLEIGELSVIACRALDSAGQLPGGGALPPLTAAVRNIDCFVLDLVERHGRRWEDIVVLGGGDGAMLLATWVHDYARPIRAAVLAAPPFDLHRRGRTSLSRRATLAGSRADRRLLAYTARRLLVDAVAVRTPTFILATARQRSVRGRLQRSFFQRLSSSVKHLEVVPDFGDDASLELWPQAALDAVWRFLVEIYRQQPRRPPLLDGDCRGNTCDEYRRLMGPLALHSPRGMFYAAAKTFIWSLAALSPGIRLGWQTGFDSGEMLDYAYQNRAHGRLRYEKWVDRIFLNNIGWKAARRRKEMIERLLREAIRRTLGSGQAVRILDIAAGPGRYVLETVRALDDARITAVLRDNTPANLVAGRALAEALKVNGVDFQWGDGFDEQSLAAVSPRPNVALACGFFELFSDNQLVLRSLRGLAAALPPDGYLVHTGQPWHPNLEMIARTLINRDRRPLVMRRRTTEELDDLVRSAGFEKIDMEIDEFGIFSVSLARRTED